MSGNGPRILIAGAGLGGLTAGIALAQFGFDVTIFEQAAVLREVGAGLTVSRSAQAVLAAIGLDEAMRELASVTRRMAFLHYRTGAILAGEIDSSDGRLKGDEPGALHIHRADMHALLASRFEAIAPGGLRLGTRVTSFVDGSGPVIVQLSDGTTAAGDILIGADGVRSAVREKLWGGGDPRFSVAITQSDGWRGEGWSTPATREELLELYAGWHPEVIGLMERAPPEHLIKWGLFDRPPLPGWLRGRTTLLGDAAHPMLPFLGLGAAMALEDAMILARALNYSPDAQGLALFEETRIERVERIAELSRLQGQMSQSRDPDRYDPSSAPAQDKTIQDYNPVTLPFIPEATP